MSKPKHGSPSRPSSNMQTRGEALGQPSMATNAQGSSSSPASPSGHGLGVGFGKHFQIVSGLGKVTRRRAVLLLTCLSLLLSCLIFPDMNWWPLGYFCLVPWLVSVCAAAKSRFLYFASYLFGLGFFLINVRWMYPVTPPGYIAMCVYCAAYFPLAAWPIRHLYRRHGISVAFTAPVIWVATEYLRSIGPAGFPWLLIGHSQYKLLTVIQISDLVGAYGVSFLLVMINGWMTDLLVQPIRLWRSDRKVRMPVGSLATLLALAGTLIYGSAQRSRQYLKPGPKVAMIQHDIPLYVSTDAANRTGTNVAYEAYLSLATLAAAEKPDLIVLPETPIAVFINREFLEAGPDALREIVERRYPDNTKVASLEAHQQFGAQYGGAFQRLSSESGIPIVIGAPSIEWKPTAVPPRVESFNSAFLLTPGAAYPTARYDKQHVVPFGESVPFRYSHPWLYKWLNSLTPWGANGANYSLTPGEAFTTFEFKAASRDDQTYRAGTPICYEEIMPSICRGFVQGEGKSEDRKNVDVLLAISNDGWFMHSAELEQHLVGGVFRAVENRVAVARSVNTGASALIHPNGRIHTRAQLSKEKIPLLDPVERTLRKLLKLADEAQAMVRDPRALEPIRQQMTHTLDSELVRAIEPLGPAYDFLVKRLRVQKSWINPRSKDFRLQLHYFRQRLVTDLATVDRWRHKPWTAPAYVIGTVQCDARLTPYTRWGDWFAQLMLGLTCLALLDWTWRRVRRPKKRDTTPATEGGES